MFDTERQVTIPEGLDEMAPGPELGEVLASVDLDTVDGYDRVVVLRAWGRQVSYADARFYQAMASVTTWMIEEQKGDLGEWDAFEAAQAEIQVALHLTGRAADIEMGLAFDLQDRLPHNFPGVGKR